MDRRGYDARDSRSSGVRSGVRGFFQVLSERHRFRRDVFAPFKARSNMRWPVSQVSCRSRRSTQRPQCVLADMPTTDESGVVPNAPRGSVRGPDGGDVITPQLPIRPMVSMPSKMYKHLPEII